MVVKDMIETLFLPAPREFGTNRTWCSTEKDLLMTIGKYNGIVNCYATIYQIPERKAYEHAMVDKIYLDCDKPDNFERLKEAHSVLLKYELKHSVLFTGGGFNLYIFADPIKLNNPKYAIEEAQKYIADICGLTIGEPKKCDIDFHVIGDVARIARIPYTKNIKYKPARWSFPLNKEHLEKWTEQEIKAYAETVDKIIIYDSKHFIFGRDTLNISKWDNDMKKLNGDEVFEDIKIKDLKDDEYKQFLEQLPPFIQEMLMNCECGWRHRYIQILAMREKGFQLKLCGSICKHYWSAQKFRHAAFEERQFHDIYKKPYLFFPTIERLQAWGFRIGKKDYEWIRCLYK